MSSVFFGNAARIISQVFSWLQTSNQKQTANLITDTFQSGIDNATNAGEGFTIVPGTAALSVTVEGQGIAYDPTSARILLSSTDTTPYNAANPSTTTNDGLGNFLSTPQSTGCVNIPLTGNSFNYLWIDYLATTNTAAFTLNEITNAKIFYQLTDGYNIQVTTTNVAPDANSIFLGTINLIGISSGIVPSSVITQTGRKYFNILPNIVPITTAQAGTNPSDRTPHYAPSSTYTLEAHIKAVGTGTGQSPTNPHNMSLADLGISSLDTVVGHRQLEHETVPNSGNASANAIIAGVPGTPSPSSSAMATSINIVNPGSDYLTVFQLLSTEFAIINGTAYNVTDIFGAIPINATVFFPNTSGTYNVYYDTIVGAFSVSTGDISSDVTKCWIAQVTYTFVGTAPSDHNALSGLIDKRRIGGTTHLLQRWFTGARPGSGSTAPQAGEFGFNLTSNVMEYWDGSAWQQPINSSSNATVPTGAYFPFAGPSAPAGFLLCNGASYSTSSFPALFGVIGYLYGGSGSSFNVPTTANLLPIGAGSIAALGATAGATTASDTVTPTEVPHQHVGTSAGVSGALYVPTISGAGSWPFGTSNVTTTSTEVAATNNPSASLAFANTSSVAATINPVTVTVSTIQPVLGATYIIKF